jgi:hypothetical protein
MIRASNIQRILVLLWGSWLNLPLFSKSFWLLIAGQEKRASFPTWRERKQNGQDSKVAFVLSLLLPVNCDEWQHRYNAVLKTELNSPSSVICPKTYKHRTLGTKFIMEGGEFQNSTWHILRQLNNFKKCKIIQNDL